MGAPGITLSEKDGCVTLQSTPTADRAVVDAAALRELLEQAGYGAWLCRSDALEKAVDGCNLEDKAFEIALAQRLDAGVQVQVADDEMTVTLTLTPAFGGERVSVEKVLDALNEAAVSMGIDEPSIREACKFGQCSHVVIAQGQPVQHGCDAVFEELIAQTVNRAPKLDDHGLIDYREHGNIAVVHPGAALMRRTPPSTGVAGRTVRGAVLEPKPGEDTPFDVKLEGTALSASDPNLLEAAISGQPVRVGRGVKVEPVFELQEVNMTSGNVHFDGTVHVRGDVLQSMKVEASGDIVVDGMVEGGVLQAGGDIRVAGGVIAHAWLHAGTSVNVRFAESAHITAGVMIAIDDMAMECELESLNQIVIGGASPKRGRLVGGSATAMKIISVPILGCDSGGLTKITLGVNAELNDQLAAVLQQIEKTEFTEKGLGRVEQQLLTVGDPKNMLGRVKASRQNAMKVLGASLVEKDVLQAKIAEGSSAKLMVTVGVAGVVDLTIGHLVVKLPGESGDGVFVADPTGHITFTDRGGLVTPAAWLGAKKADLLGKA